MSKDHAKRLAELEERCKNMPDLPEDFEDFCKSCFGLSVCYYKRRKNHADLFCCACGESYTIRTQAKETYEGSMEKVYETPIHGRTGKCIKCGKFIEYSSGVRRAASYTDRKTILIGQRYQEKGYVLRNFEVTRTYAKERKEEYVFEEMVRSFYLPGKRKVQEDWKKWNWYYNNKYWDYTGFGGFFKQTEHKGDVYPNTYRQMRGTCLEYSMINQYIEYEENKDYTVTAWTYNLRDYLNAYQRFPVIEALVKIGAYGIVKDMTYSWRSNIFHINNRAKTPYDMLRIKKKRFAQIADKTWKSIYWLEWYQYERKNGDIDDAVIEFFVKEFIDVKEIGDMLAHMTPKQCMNYLLRQKQESYEKHSIRSIVSQYSDYISMCIRLGKNISDEMVYRPRQLKRRHDECVAQIERQKAQVKAEEYSAKFAEAEKVLGEIRKKFEYEGEQFFIRVPERIIDIVLEGNYLHHCAGATDRYFDRIKNHETYICFLRKVTEPETPFYTIEVEPGGTIRQHRGMYDEEPELEMVKPFLMEWQQVIRKRMTEKDHQLAAVSKVKREENIEDLKQRNNTRVLQGLMEDFMEAAI